MIDKKDTSWRWVIAKEFSDGTIVYYDSPKQMWTSLEKCTTWTSKSLAIQVMKNVKSREVKVSKSSVAYYIDVVGNWEDDQK